MTITVKANSRNEAEAKLELLLQLGCFVSDLDAGALGIAFLKYRLLKFAGDSYQSPTDVNKRQPVL